MSQNPMFIALDCVKRGGGAIHLCGNMYPSFGSLLITDNSPVAEDSRSPINERLDLQRVE